MKFLTGILGIIAALACLATIGVIGYTLIEAGGGSSNTQAVIQEKEPAVDADAENGESTPIPASMPEADPEATRQPVSFENHVHDYRESVEKKATCYQAGRLKYTCTVCGDYYYADIHSTGHIAGDKWETVRNATQERDGLQIKRCIYCDEIVAEETIPYLGVGQSNSSSHVHNYLAETMREPTCILAGLRKYQCECGSFYTEQIPAPGHVATDWIVAEAATDKKLGREQRTCTVCGVLLDSRPIPVLSPSPSAGAGTSASAGTSAGGTATAAPTATSTAAPAESSSPGANTSASPGASASPHTHDYSSYVLKEANCTETGIRSFVCAGCGSSYAETIERDLNRHNYIVAMVVPSSPVSTGYTLYRCSRCNATYMDNYTAP